MDQCHGDLKCPTLALYHRADQLDLSREALCWEGFNFDLHRLSDLDATGELFWQKRSRQQVTIIDNGEERLVLLHKLSAHDLALANDPGDWRFDCGVLQTQLGLLELGFGSFIAKPGIINGFVFEAHAPLLQGYFCRLLLHAFRVQVLLAYEPPTRHGLRPAMLLAGFHRREFGIAHGQLGFLLIEAH